MPISTRLVEVTPAGHPVEVWRPRIESAPVLDLDQWSHLLGVDDGPTRLVVVAAHPDDETLGAGRLVAEWSEVLGPTSSVLITLGEACLDHVATRPPGLELRRLEEWRRATERLGVRDPYVLQLPDGQLGSRLAELDLLLGDVVEQLLGSGPLVLAAPWRRDPHPDHQAAGLVASQIAERIGAPLLEYPVWMTYWSEPGLLDAERAEDRTHLSRLTVSQHADLAHADAVACYPSQTRPLADGLTAIVPADMLEHHRHQLLLTAVDPRPRAAAGAE